MMLPLLRVEDDVVQFNFDQIAKGFLNTGGVSLSLSGPYTADSGSVVAGAQSAVITVTHSIGKTPVLVVGHLEDGAAGWAHQFGWRVVRSSTDVQFRFFNLGPNTPGQAVLHFYLLA